MKETALRRIALRLATLSEPDRRWLMAQLSAEEGQRVSALLADLEDKGLTRHLSVVAAALTAPDTAPAVQDDGVSALLDALRKPLWRAVLVRSLPEEERRQWEQELLTENPFIYRQLFADPVLSRLPPAWAGVLREHASRRGRP